MTVQDEIELLFLKTIKQISTLPVSTALHS